MGGILWGKIKERLTLMKTGCLLAVLWGPVRFVTGPKVSHTAAVLRFSEKYSVYPLVSVNYSYPDTNLREGGLGSDV